MITIIVEKVRFIVAARENTHCGEPWGILSKRILGFGLWLSDFIGFGLWLIELWRV